MSEPRRVLLTGATGFAGSHLLDALVAAGHRVRVPLRPTSDRRWLPEAGVETMPADVRDAGSLRALVAGVSWIFHFGGVVRARRPEAFFQVNTEGTIRLYEAAAQAGGCELFLFCSSLAATGPAPSADRPRREEDPPAPITAYGRSKRDAEVWLEAHPEPGTRLVVVRPPAIYGPRDQGVVTFFRWVGRGVLPLPAGRGALLSLVEARDLAGACLHLAERGADGIFHVSDGAVHTWEALGALAAQALGRSPVPLRVPGALVGLAGEVGALLGTLTGTMPVINPDKARDLRQRYWICAIDRLRGAGYEPRTPIERGIHETIDWFRREGRL
ncbi:MAG: NAD(P)-dependent oxidoreductase [Candidatus Eisenbacteria bacterium]|uniref:NAD(P)-dependent oxidoreductase n=1 Tax=Eiseniibacteriota bacterium TaxID=2212470 RepID=A0A937X7E1_UNCEI|nr:NAD(P)-dependent oxidoreductase [Candidatus Eisenbacteria bacterium]